MRNERQPSLIGIPGYFRRCVIAANNGTNQKIYDIDMKKHIRSTFFDAGYYLALQGRHLLSKNALLRLKNIEKEKDTHLFANKIIKFFEQEFPNCMRLIPPAEQSNFFKGVHLAISEGKFPLTLPKVVSRKANSLFQPSPY